jgi:hypothetical protein
MSDLSFNLMALHFVQFQSNDVEVQHAHLTAELAQRLH